MTAPAEPRSAKYAARLPLHVRERTNVYKPAWINPPKAIFSLLSTCGVDGFKAM
jgi:hypothetical protein